MPFLDNFEIIDYKPEDCKELLKFWELTNLGNAARGDDNIVIEKTLQFGGKLLVIKQLKDRQIIGSSWMTTDGRRLYLHHFGIHPDFQGQGLSKPLMDASMKFVYELGQQVKLEVHKNNTTAINLYKKYGFKYLGDYMVYILRGIPKS